VRVRIGSGPRLPAFPLDDEPLGQALVERLGAQLARGPVPPVAILLGPEDVRVVSLGPILQRGGDIHRMLAALTSQPGVEAMAVVAMMFRGRRGGPRERFAGVFVEWTDGRWWGCWRPVDEHGRPIPTDSEDIQRAVDGLARPAGLGAWFSRARFEGLRAEIRASTPPPAPEGELVN
jgi:hypothetical protein